MDRVDFELNYRSEPNFTDHEDPLVLAVKKNVEAFLGTQVVPAYQWASSDARDYRRQEFLRSSSVRPIQWVFTPTMRQWR